MKLTISEWEKKSILKMYGLINEQTTSGQKDKIVCDESGCRGTYSGPEVAQNGNDQAHDFSNDMTNKVGDKLKELYNIGIYSKVDLTNIVMKTPGMGTGKNYVDYTLEIPFINVTNKCDAYTSFDHRGGWGHGGAGKKDDIIGALSNEPVDGTNLDISREYKTKEGLVEYWVQWKNKNYQSECGGQSTPTQQIITITGTDIENFRQNIKKETKDLSIDLKSVSLNINSNKLTFKKGDTQIKNMSLIYDSVSADNLYQRIYGNDWVGKKDGEKNIVDKNVGSNLYELKGPLESNGYHYILLYFTN